MKSIYTQNKNNAYPFEGRSTLREDMIVDLYISGPFNTVTLSSLSVKNGKVDILIQGINSEGLVTIIANGSFKSVEAYTVYNLSSPLGNGFVVFGTGITENSYVYNNTEDLVLSLGVFIKTKPSPRSELKVNGVEYTDIKDLKINFRGSFTITNISTDSIIIDLNETIQNRMYKFNTYTLTNASDPSVTYFTDINGVTPDINGNIDIIGLGDISITQVSGVTSGVIKVSTTANIDGSDDCTVYNALDNIRFHTDYGTTTQAPLDGTIRPEDCCDAEDILL